MVPDNAPPETSRPRIAIRSAKMDRGGARASGNDGNRAEPTASSSTENHNGGSSHVGSGAAGALEHEIEALCADDLTEDKLRRIAGTRDLSTVNALALVLDTKSADRSFGAVELLGASLPNLQELCLDGSQLASLRDLGTELGNLTSLSLADCGLDELDGVAAMPSLRSLRLPGNRIDDLTPLCTHDCLQVLDVRRNFLADLAGLSFLATCASLYSLDLRGNPCHAALTTPASAAAAAAAFHEATSTQDTTPPSSSSSAKHVGLYGSTAAVATSAGAGIAAGAAAAVPAAFPYRGLVLFHLPGLKVLDDKHVGLGDRHAFTTAATRLLTATTTGGRGTGGVNSISPRDNSNGNDDDDDEDDDDGGVNLLLRLAEALVKQHGGSRRGSATDATAAAAEDHLTGAPIYPDGSSGNSNGSGGSSSSGENGPLGLGGAGAVPWERPLGQARASTNPSLRPLGGAHGGGLGSSNSSHLSLDATSALTAGALTFAGPPSALLRDRRRATATSSSTPSTSSLLARPVLTSASADGGIRAAGDGGVLASGSGSGNSGVVGLRELSSTSLDGAWAPGGVAGAATAAGVEGSAAVRTSSGEGSRSDSRGGGGGDSRGSKRREREKARKAAVVAGEGSSLAVGANHREGEEAGDGGGREGSSGNQVPSPVEASREPVPFMSPGLSGYGGGNGGRNDVFWSPGNESVSSAGSGNWDPPYATASTTMSLRGGPHDPLLGSGSSGLVASMDLFAPTSAASPTLANREQQQLRARGFPLSHDASSSDLLNDDDDDEGFKRGLELSQGTRASRGSRSSGGRPPLAFVGVSQSFEPDSATLAVGNSGSGFGFDGSSGGGNGAFGVSALRDSHHGRLRPHSAHLPSREHAEASLVNGPAFVLLNHDDDDDDNDYGGNNAAPGVSASVRVSSGVGAIFSPRDSGSPVFGGPRRRRQHRGGRGFTMGADSSSSAGAGAGAGAGAKVKYSGAHPRRSRGGDSDSDDGGEDGVSNMKSRSRSSGAAAEGAGKGAAPNTGKGLFNAPDVSASEWVLRDGKLVSKQSQESQDALEGSSIIIGNGENDVRRKQGGRGGRRNTRGGNSDDVKSEHSDDSDSSDNSDEEGGYGRGNGSSGGFTSRAALKARAAAVALGSQAQALSGSSEKWEATKSSHKGKTKSSSGGSKGRGKSKSNRLLGSGFAQSDVENGDSDVNDDASSDDGDGTGKVSGLEVAPKHTPVKRQDLLLPSTGGTGQDDSESEVEVEDDAGNHIEGAKTAAAATRVNPLGSHHDSSSSFRRPSSASAWSSHHSSFAPSPQSSRPNSRPTTSGSGGNIGSGNGGSDGGEWGHSSSSSSSSSRPSSASRAYSRPGSNGSSGNRSGSRPSSSSGNRPGSSSGNGGVSSEAGRRLGFDLEGSLTAIGDWSEKATEAQMAALEASSHNANGDSNNRSGSGSSGSGGSGSGSGSGGTGGGGPSSNGSVLMTEAQRANRERSARLLASNKGHDLRSVSNVSSQAYNGPMTTTLAASPPSSPAVAPSSLGRPSPAASPRPRHMSSSSSSASGAAAEAAAPSSCASPAYSPLAPAGVRPNSAEVVRRSAVFREVGYGGSSQQASSATSSAAAANDAAAAASISGTDATAPGGAPLRGTATTGSGAAAAATATDPSHTPGRSAKNEVATSFSDDALVGMLRQPPKQVPHLRTRESFRRFFTGFGENRMARLLESACAGTGTTEEAAHRAQKRLSLVREVLAKD